MNRFAARVRGQEVIILGAGPAGCAAALGLTRLGVIVRIVGQPRIDSIEGVSPRTLDLLKAAGLVDTVRCCAAPTPRVAYWAGKRITGSAACGCTRPAARRLE